MNNKDKFIDKFITAKGEKRGFIPFDKLETLWFLTGTVCNLECINCYIESSPKNDSLSFLTLGDVKSYLDEVKDLKLLTKRIGFTGGEPFLNPNFISILEETLSRGFEVLVLTNAYKVIRSPKNESKLLDLINQYKGNLQLRVSLDHHTQDIHDRHRGDGKFEQTLKNIKYFSDFGATISIAGRSLIGEESSVIQKSYQTLLDNFEIGLILNSENLVVFPEMDSTKEVPEITEKCFDILNKKKNSIMCSNERMVLKRKGEETPKVVACTLLTNSLEFELGHTLKDSFSDIYLNHSYCASFCVLGGASCSST